MQVELAQLEYLLPACSACGPTSPASGAGSGSGGRERRSSRPTDASSGAHCRPQAEAREGGQGPRDPAAAARAGSTAWRWWATRTPASPRFSALSGADVLVEDRLFATLDSATRQVEVGHGYQALLTDTVGFIRKLPHHLVASFRSTLEEAREADLLVHVVDASHPRVGGADARWWTRSWRSSSWWKSRASWSSTRWIASPTTRRTPSASGSEPSIPRPRSSCRRWRRGARRPPGGRSGPGCAPASPGSDLELPAGEGEWLAALHREGEVLDVQGGNRVHVTARVPAPLLGRLRQAEGILRN
jgi:GTPase